DIGAAAALARRHLEHQSRLAHDAEAHLYRPDQEAWFDRLQVGSLAGFGSQPRFHSRDTAGLTPEPARSDPGSTGPQSLRAVLLGGFGIGVGDAPLATPGTPRIQSLLAYLLLRRQTPQLRQHLAFMLWPDSTEPQARANLRNLIHGLQHTLPQV